MKGIDLMDKKHDFPLKEKVIKFLKNKNYSSKYSEKIFRIAKKMHSIANMKPNIEKWVENYVKEIKEKSTTTNTLKERFYILNTTLKATIPNINRNILFKIKKDLFNKNFSLKLNHQERLIIKEKNYEQSLSKYHHNKDILPEHKKILLEILNDSYHTVIQYRTDMLRNGIIIQQKLNKPLKDITKNDVDNFLIKIKTVKVNDYKLIQLTKRYLRLAYNQKNPFGIIKYKNPIKRKIITPNTLITREELAIAINNLQSLTHKAILTTLYESGCRITEILNLKVGEVEFRNDDEALLTVGGIKNSKHKRTILMSKNTYWLKQYLSQHPLKNDGESHLWLSKQLSPLRTRFGLTAIRRSLEFTGKPTNFHNLRHHRVTELKKQGYTDADLRIYFGWSTQSMMVAHYTHLKNEDVINKIIKTKKEKLQLDLPTTCNCGINNPANSQFCGSCGNKLKTKKVHDLLHHFTKDEILDIIDSSSSC